MDVKAISQKISKDIMSASGASGPLFNTPMMTPKEMFYVIKGFGRILKSGHRDVAALSYPSVSLAQQMRIAQIFEQVGDVVASNNYDSVLWMPEIWDSATSGAEVFVDTKYNIADAPQRPVFWWYAVPEQYNEVPFLPGDNGESADWWTPEWVLQGIYMWPSDRIVDPELYKKFGGRNGVEDATGLMTIWSKTLTVNNETGYDPDDLAPRIAFYPGLPYGDPIIPGYATMVAASRFLKLPFVATKTEQVLNHNERKEYKRSNTKPPEVTTILLRKPEKKQVESENENHIDFGCHFIVGGLHGFWRKAKVNSKSGNPEFVKPYIKGDTSKPFKAPSTVIHVAKR
jgi:hypothetical protein